jgi:thiol-disulfide isomerase/thioredoxin
MRVISFIALLAVCLSLTAQSYAKVSESQIEELLRQKNDTTYVINFFASWCAPCVQELPELQAFAVEHRTEKVKLILVSLDFEEDAEDALMPLLNKYTITEPVWLLSESGNRWIARVDKHWNGSIPATLLVNHQLKKREFITQRVTNASLNQSLKNP